MSNESQGDGSGLEGFSVVPSPLGIIGEEKNDLFLKETPIVDHLLVSACLRLSVHNGDHYYRAFRDLISAWIMSIKPGEEHENFPITNTGKPVGWTKRGEDIETVATNIDIQQLGSIAHAFQINDKYVYDIFMKMIEFEKATWEDRSCIQGCIDRAFPGAIVGEAGPCIIRVPEGLRDSVEDILAS